MSILELFYSVDDFWHQIAPSWHHELLTSGQRQRLRPTQLHRSRDHDHRHPVPKLAKGLVCNLFGDTGYLSQPLAQKLLVTQGLQLITKLRKKMHNRLLDLSDKLLLRKRANTRTLTDQLENVCQIEHSRHRSPVNFLVNLIADLIAYCHQPKEPSLGLQLPALTQL